jgi:hypothetical protein
LLIYQTLNEAIAGFHPTAWGMMNRFGSIRDDVMSRYYSFLVESASTDPVKKAEHDDIWQGNEVTIHDAIDFCMVDAHESMRDTEPEEEDGPCSYFDRYNLDSGDEGESGDDDDDDEEEESVDETESGTASKRVKEEEETAPGPVSKKVKLEKKEII